jgi:hypothetical protein
MFGNPLAAYTKRLQGVRKELAELEKEMDTLDFPDKSPEALIAVCLGVEKLANILGRVIDSLPK